MPRALKVLPGEFRIQGYVNSEGQPALKWQAGENVPQSSAQELLSYFTESRYSILNLARFARMDDVGPLRPLYLELAERDYDISTLSFSIFVQDGGFKLPKRLGYGRQYPGVLHSRWARLEHEGLDVCVFWRRPCRKADVNLWFSLLASATCTLEQMNAMGELALKDAGMLAAIKRLGFDQRSLRFTVKSKLPPHPDDLPPPPEARLVKVQPDTCPSFVDTCPVCGAEDGQMCSVVDPADGKGVELVDQVHASRFEDYAPPRRGSKDSSAASSGDASAPSETA